LRARDNRALEVLLKYRRECVSENCNELHLAGIDAVITKFEAFALEHPDRMKQPGITRHLKLDTPQPALSTKATKHRMPTRNEYQSCPNCDIRWLANEVLPCPKCGPQLAPELLWPDEHDDNRLTRELMVNLLHTRLREARAELTDADVFLSKHLNGLCEALQIEGIPDADGHVRLDHDDIEELRLLVVGKVEEYKAEIAKLRAELEQANNYKGEYWKPRALKAEAALKQAIPLQHWIAMLKEIAKLSSDEEWNSGEASDSDYLESFDPWVVLEAAVLRIAKVKLQATRKEEHNGK